MLISPFGEGFVGVYHATEPGEWDGPTGFYHDDYRAPLATDESKTWSPIHVWADPSFEGDIMYFSLMSDPENRPPQDREYTLELLAVPEGIDDAPPVGTSWDLPLDELFTLVLPTYRTTDGLEGYQFSYTITEQVPEPTAMGLLTIGVASILSRRRRRRQQPLVKGKTAVRKRRW